MVLNATFKNISVIPMAVSFIGGGNQEYLTGWWFSLDTPVSSTNKTVRHDITEILGEANPSYSSLKVPILIIVCNVLTGCNKNR
jgi:hypothetical protein